MENKAIVDDQKVQQIGQNPVNQPGQIPEKPKVNYLLIGLIILSCFVIFGIGGYYLGTQKTTQNSIDDIFNSDPLAPDIAFNKTFTTVDGQRAIQYDYSYEGHVATMTIFTKNGIYYTVKFRYVDKNGKQALWNDYVKLLTSFRIK